MSGLLRFIIILVTIGLLALLLIITLMITHRATSLNGRYSLNYPKMSS